jgi:hypothetical protein
MDGLPIPSATGITGLLNLPYTRTYVEELTTFIYHRPILNTLRHPREVKSVDRISYKFLSWCEVADKQTD